MKKFWLLFGVVLVALLAACGEDEASDDDLFDIATLEVDFIVPETAEVGETVTLEAIVTSSGEYVDDADEVLFEYWIAEDEAGEDLEVEESTDEGDETDELYALKPGSTAVDSEYNGDGSYQAEVVFEEAAVYEIYAHTTARGLHTMPLKTITVE